MTNPTTKKEKWFINDGEPFTTTEQIPDFDEPIVDI